MEDPNPIPSPLQISPRPSPELSHQNSLISQQNSLAGSHSSVQENAELNQVENGRNSEEDRQNQNEPEQTYAQRPISYSRLAVMSQRAKQREIINGNLCQAVAKVLLEVSKLQISWFIQIQCKLKVEASKLLKPSLNFVYLSVASRFPGKLFLTPR